MNEIAEIPPQNILKETKWRDENERILKSWADKAQCYQMMHDRAHKRYWCLNAWFTIPVIIFSTITGTGNFAQKSVSENWKMEFVMAIGTINILSGIITTIAQFIGVAQKSEGHRMASIHWDKFSRKIKVELSKNRDDRVDCNNFMLTCQQDYDRLIETSPNIPTDIIRWFKNLVKGKTEDKVGGCQLCLYEFYCFPFGIECCNRSLGCCNSGNNNSSNNELIGIDMPEIIGKLKPTLINTSSNHDDNNEYNIYNENQV